MAIGGVGVISVAANIIPADVARMCASFDSGDLKTAKRLHYNMLPLVKAMFVETNPIPVKTAMGMMKMIDPALRLPMCAMDPANEDRLRKELKAYGLIK
jgi:4-hydroxy-tetrahydrodipicolinate synthase